MKQKADAGAARLYARSVGLVTAVGLTARSSAAALRSGINRFEEIPFHDVGGRPIIGARVPRVADGLQGLGRYAALLSAAIADVDLEGSGMPSRLPIVIGIPRSERPGRPAKLETDLLGALESHGRWSFDRERSYTVAGGNTAGMHGLRRARSILADTDAPAVLVACVDSYLNRKALDHLEVEMRLKTEDNPDGVIPGEAAAAILVTRSRDRQASPPLLEIAGLGFGHEEGERPGSTPNTGRGLAAAVKGCLTEAGVTTAATHFRIGDVAGERRRFSEASYASSRTVRESHADYPLWLPAESFGDIGAASGAALLIIAAMAFTKGYAPGPGALCQTASTSGERAAAYVAASN